jgi:shikimate kinase
MAPRVVLVGPPGSGKTTVGRLLAQRWGVGFRDTDADVVEAAGMDVADIFIDQGEERFRELERDAVAAALTEHDGVLALGGGAVTQEATRGALRGHTVVFLDVGLTDAVRRVGLNRDRPLLLGNPRAQWKQLMDARRSLYEEVAVISVLTDDLSAADVADAVAQQVQEREGTS